MTTAIRCRHNFKLYEALYTVAKSWNETLGAHIVALYMFYSAAVSNCELQLEAEIRWEIMCFTLPDEPQGGRFRFFVKCGTEYHSNRSKRISMTEPFSMQRPETRSVPDNFLSLRTSRWRPRVHCCKMLGWFGWKKKISTSNISK